MKPISVNRLASFLGGRARVRGDGATVVRGISTDSRTLRPGELFLPLRGERFDGHDFIGAALARGASAVVADPRRWPGAGGDGRGGAIPVIEVEDTLQALQDIAGGYARSLGLTVLGVTGSTGKTTTKDLLAAMLGAWQPTVKSRQNQNNDIGVPLTLLQAGADTRFAVVEMGMRGSGELARLCAVAAPRVGVVTNIGPVHVGRLGSVEAVAAAKAELLDALPPTGVAVLNGDDGWSRRVAHRSRAPILWYGRGEGAALRLLGVEGRGLEPLRLDIAVAWPGGLAGGPGDGPRRRQLHVPIPGRHNALNALGAAAAALAVGCPWQAIVEGASAAAAQRTDMRMEVQRWDGLLLINDAYNASPPSMEAALTALAEVEGGRKVAVLGDMLELGPLAPEAHRALGRQAAAAGVQLLIAVGEWAGEVLAGARDAGLPAEKGLAAADAQEAAEKALAHIRPGDVCLVKASRGVRLERVVDALRASWAPRPAGRGEAL